MKRSERYQRESRHAALLAAMILSASVAGCVWLVALIEPLPSGGAVAAAVGVAGLCTAWRMLGEALRLRRMSLRESRWEWERSIRPRI